MSGWIKIYRDIITHWIWEDPAYLKAWITILLSVNHEDKDVLIQKELVECNRGQSLMSLESWAKTFGRRWTIQRVRTFFELLRNDNMITTEGLRKTTRLTVCNYDIYQNGQQTKNKLRTDKEQADNKLTTTNKNDKEHKEVKKYSNIPPTLEEIKLRFQERQLKTFSPEKFHAHYSANGWMVGKNKMKNWDAALTTWENSKNNSNGTDRQSDSRSPKRINDYWNKQV